MSFETNDLRLAIAKAKEAGFTHAKRGNREPISLDDVLEDYGANAVSFIPEKGRMLIHDCAEFDAVDFRLLPLAPASAQAEPGEGR